MNAIVTLLPEAARRAAQEADAARARGDPLGPLHGLPVAVKDLVLTRGVRTTFGSPIFADHVPDQDALIVERMRRAGAIVIGKTNTPELGAGSQTYNEVFGETLNPWNELKTCGGSSGGAAVALACGMVALADGSDFGGSLRNPASFCNVVGLRPSPGRVPSWPTQLPWFPLTVEGPMGRTVQDAALLLSVLAGPDRRSPIALTEPGDRFSGDLWRDFTATRVAFSADLGGLPVDARVSAVIEDARPTLAALGCRVSDGQPDFAGGDRAFKLWRAWSFEASWGHLLDDHRDAVKQTVVEEIERGRRLTGPELSAAERGRGELYQRSRAFMEDVEFLVAPVAQVPPFDVDQRWVERIDDVEMESYVDWMRSCYLITVTGLPAISVPCGFTPEGLPVGLQIVGRHQDDRGVLELAYAFQEATRLWRRRPPAAV